MLPPKKKDKFLYRCSKCGKHIYVSRNRTKHLCKECRQKNIDANIEQLRSKEGPFYDGWKAGLVRALNQKPKGSK